MKFSAFNTPPPFFFALRLVLPRIRGAQNQVAFVGCIVEIHLKYVFEGYIFSFPTAVLDNLEHCYSSVLSPVTLQVFLDICSNLFSFGQNIQVL